MERRPMVEVTLPMPRAVYRSRPPAPPLDAFVDAIWLFEGEPRAHALERIMPSGSAQLIVNLAEDETRLYDADAADSAATPTTMAGTVFCGAFSQFCVIDTLEQQTVIGASFKPGGAFPFFREPADATTNRHVPLELLWGRAAASRLRQRVLEASSPNEAFDAIEDSLATAFVHPRGLHPAVAFALDRFNRRPGIASVGGVIGAVGLSPKRFIERFRREVGLTPKAYCRVRRFQRALRATQTGGEIDWAHLAASTGYFDQAHFIHDFRAFSGITPTMYRAFRTPYQNHVKFLQSGD